MRNMNVSWQNKIKKLSSEHVVVVKKTKEYWKEQKILENNSIYGKVVFLNKFLYTPIQLWAATDMCSKCKKRYAVFVVGEYLK